MSEDDLNDELAELRENWESDQQVIIRLEREVAELRADNEGLRRVNADNLRKIAGHGTQIARLYPSTCRDLAALRRVRDAAAYARKFFHYGTSSDSLRKLWKALEACKD